MRPLLSSKCNATGSGTVFFSAPVAKDMPRKEKVNIKFISYLHYELSCRIDGVERSVVTSNLDLIHRLNSELEEEKKEAVKEALELIKAG